MSYIPQGQTIHQFVPNYVVKSDYLPTRVVEGNNSQAAQLVTLIINLSSANMRKKKEEDESSPPDQPNSTLADTLHSKSQKLLELITPLTNKASAVLSEDEIAMIQVNL